MISFTTNCSGIPRIIFNEHYYSFNNSMLELQGCDCICSLYEKDIKILKHREIYLLSDIGYVLWAIYIRTDMTIIRILFFQEYILVHIIPQFKYDIWLSDTTYFFEGVISQYNHLLHKILKKISDVNSKEIESLYQWIVQSRLNEKYMPIYNYYCEIARYKEGL